MGLLSGIFHRDDAGNETPLAVENAVEGAEAAVGASAPADPAEVARLKAELAEARSTLSATQAAQLKGRVDGIRAAADAHALGLVTAKKLMPAGREGLAALHAFAALHTAGLPTEGFDPVASLKSLEAGLVPHNLTAEAVEDGEVPAGLRTVHNGSAGADGKPSEAQIKELLAKHPSGAAALARMKNGKA